MEQLRRHIFFYLLLLLISGIFLIDVARVVPSLSMILIGLLGISFVVKPGLSNIEFNRIWIYFPLTFLITIPSVLYSDNFNYLTERWQILVPYLVLPLAFGVIPFITKDQYRFCYWFYILLTSGVAAHAMVYYLNHPEEVNQLYLESKVMPTFVSHHPTLSMMVVLAFFLSYFLLTEAKGWQKILLMVLGSFLFIFLHVFSVRSGLLALYLVLGVEILRIMLVKKKWKHALGAALTALVVGGITLYFSPTVRNKIINTTQDIEVVKSNASANNQSLASRVISYKNAIEIAENSSWIFGCGLGDVFDLNEKIFEEKYPDVTKRIMPHNQFLFYLAAIGILGLILFLWFFYKPLFFFGGWNNPVLFYQYLILTVSFQFEAPLENQLGVAFSLIFLLLPMHEALAKKSKSNS